MGGQTKSYLKELGIQPYALRPQLSQAVSAPTSAAAAPTESNDKEDVSQMDWETLRRTVTNCSLCGLHKTRTRAVFGVGDPRAEWLVIGEAPGADEDRQGEPFVGRAGQLLDSMLRALGLKRGENVYIANILKSRPPNNREPAPAEVASCLPYLQRQIELIQPRIILAVGRIAAQNLLQTDTPIGRMRGRVYQYGHGAAQIPVVVTYHPAYLLRSPGEKRKAWTDLKFAQEVLRHGRG
jgi:uracil-DNA glycosylase family 4